MYNISLPYSEIYSYPNIKVNPSQIPSLQQPKNLQFAPFLITNPKINCLNHQEIIPFSTSNDSKLIKYSNINQVEEISINHDHQNSKPNIIINYTIINNYATKNKKKKCQKVKNDNKETNESNNFLEEKLKIDEFVESIRLFIQSLEINDGEQSILNHCISFGICRRRIYDIINVT